MAVSTRKTTSSTTTPPVGTRLIRSVKNDGHSVRNSFVKTRPSSCAILLRMYAGSGCPGLRPGSHVTKSCLSVQRSPGSIAGYL